MATISGGIFGRVRNKTGDIVFSQARSRKGTVNTLRQLVIPANPNSPAQSSNRGKFGLTARFLRAAGIQNYQRGLNRYVDQLPAFQSLASTLMRLLSSNSETETFPSKVFGSDYELLNVSVTASAIPGVPDITFDASGEDLSDAVIRVLGVEFSDEPLVSTDILGYSGSAVSPTATGNTLTPSVVFGDAVSPSYGKALVWIESADGLKKGNAVGVAYSNT